MHQALCCFQKYIMLSSPGNIIKFTGYSIVITGYSIVKLTGEGDGVFAGGQVVVAALVGIEGALGVVVVDGVLVGVVGGLVSVGVDVGLVGDLGGGGVGHDGLGGVGDDGGGLDDHRLDHPGHNWGGPDNRSRELVGFKKNFQNRLCRGLSLPMKVSSKKTKYFWALLQT